MSIYAQTRPYIVHKIHFPQFGAIIKQNQNKHTQNITTHTHITKMACIGSLVTTRYITIHRKYSLSDITIHDRQRFFKPGSPKTLILWHLSLDDGCKITNSPEIKDQNNSSKTVSIFFA